MLRGGSKEKGREPEESERRNGGRVDWLVRCRAGYRCGCRVGAETYARDGIPTGSFIASPGSQA
jgi:hypothetical protein